MFIFIFMCQDGVGGVGGVHMTQMTIPTLTMHDGQSMIV